MYKKNPKCSLDFRILHTVMLRCTIHTFWMWTKTRRCWKGQNEHLAEGVVDNVPV